MVDVDRVSILGKESIHVGYDMAQHMAKTLLEQTPAPVYAVISDTNMADNAVLKKLLAALGAEREATISRDHVRVLEFYIPPGERSKSAATKARVEQFLLEHQCTRDTVIVAVGGGVIGDMIGYVAATFMRGVRYVQVPTTLLAMVDSSIGGKTAIDTPQGKNLVGAFWQPTLNLCELAFLETLPEREFINGMAEVIKTAAIWDAVEFTRLERVAPAFFGALSTRNPATDSVDLAPIREDLRKLVLGSVRVKADVVTRDEREGGLRNILNFGHSIGHAFEAAWTPHVLHGECVAVGMVLEAELSRFRGLLSASDVARLAACLRTYRLPVSAQDPVVLSRVNGRIPTSDELLATMAIDKKNAGGVKRVTLLRRIGETAEPRASAVPDSELRVILGSEISVGQPTESPESFEVIPPGSKSISNRVLVLAALGTGTCRISNLLHSDDTGVMLDALATLGAAHPYKDGDDIVVTGHGGSFASDTNQDSVPQIYLGNAGTAARFLTAVCAALVTQKTVLTGNKRMQERPIGPLVDALRSASAKIGYQRSEGSLPLEMEPSSFRGGRIELDAAVSSQYVSALLMVSPYATEPVELVLKGKPVSELYIDMTVQMMGDFGITVEKVPGTWTYRIPKGVYRNPALYAVESDASSATYPLALAALGGARCTVPTVGSRSLQGDAQFAPQVLAPMGCIVEQTPTSTTVQGPPRGSLKAIESIDMEPMTDAFLTAAVVASLSHGTTTITGIANQRVKECNRLEAMRTELGKFGVTVSEFDDGISVTGVSLGALPNTEVTVDPRDDHRVAMSLSLLGIQANAPVVVRERRCVEKTWPGWWDTLHGLRIPLEGRGAVVEPAKGSGSGSGGSRNSIILIGMRGAGKSETAANLASVLGYTAADLDTEFKAVLGPVRAYVTQHGWAAFRTAEVQLFTDFMARHPTNYVVAAGGGLVETLEARNALKAWHGPVVHVHRSLDAIVAYLGADASRPSLAEDPVDVYMRREPWYRECSNRYVFSGPVGTLEDRQSLLGSLQRLFGPAPAPMDPSSGGFFVSLTLPNLAAITREELAEITEGCAAIELRVDLLESWHREFVAEQVGLVRLRTALPIIFTVRTQSQGGRFRDSDTTEYLELVRLAFKMGVEFVDVELGQPLAIRAEITKLRTAAQLGLGGFAGPTRVIASHHDPQGLLKWSGIEWQTHLFHASRLGDVVKFVGFATSIEDNLELEAFRASTRDTHLPLVAINMGPIGRLSRVLNPLLTPVTHERLPLAAAPGQMTVRAIHEARAAVGMVQPLQFFVTGSPIAHSRSPALHNAAFKAVGLPHHYGTLETTRAEDVLQRIKLLGAKFGGANVTIPLKEAVTHIVHELTPAAEAIGAVNTIIPRGSKLVGGNTDWVGIRDAFTRHGLLTGAGGRAALVVGAGGTALAAVYAFHHMGFARVYVLNRTRERAESVAERLSSLVPVKVVDDPSAVTDVTAILSCVPGDRVLPDGMQAALGTILSSNSPGVLLEAAYKPDITPVMHAAVAHGWTTIPGREMLVLQGVESFYAWTGLRAPHASERAVLGE